jgi:hypothetical protein
MAADSLGDGQVGMPSFEHFKRGLWPALEAGRPCGTDDLVSFRGAIGGKTGPGLAAPLALSLARQVQMGPQVNAHQERP